MTLEKFLAAMETPYSHGFCVGDKVEIKTTGEIGSIISVGVSGCVAVFNGNPIGFEDFSNLVKL